MTDHPITPPPELVQQWVSEIYDHPAFPLHSIALELVGRAAQWGADTELEACCDFILSASSDPAVTGDAALVDKRALVDCVRAACRPKPPSLKEQALTLLDDASNRLDAVHENTIRRALESLPD